MSRARRHDAILRLLSAGPVAGQDALRAALAAQGIEVAQGTLSRDLRELGAFRGPSGYVLGAGVREQAAGTVALAGQLAQHVVGVAAAQGLVVLRTTPGSAGVVALELDRHPPRGVAGTVAGDDTVFVAVSARASARLLAERLMVSAGLSRRAGA